MKHYQFTCQYCDYKWEKSYYYNPTVDNLKCLKCGDKNIDIVNYKKIDYYKETKDEE